MSYQRGKVVRNCAIVLAILVFSICAYAEQQTSIQTYHLFYGKVLDTPDGAKITAKVEAKNFSTVTKNGQYGYDPEFRIVGLENSVVNFYVDSANVINATLQLEGMSRLDLSIKPPKQDVKVSRPPAIVQPPQVSRPVPKQITLPRQESESSSLWLVLLSAGLLILIGVMMVLYLKKRRVKTVDVESTAYVKNMLKLVYSREQIVEYFGQHGWSKESVEEIFKHL